MKKGKDDSFTVTYGGARVLGRRRGDGRWKVAWREAGKARSTTLATREKAVEKAELKVRELSSGQGGRMMTIDDHGLVVRLRKVCGERSPFVVLDRLERVVEVLGGWEVMERALAHYEASGLAAVERVRLSVAYERFVSSYGKRDPKTLETFDKEMGLFCKTYGEMLVCDLAEDFLGGWVNRLKEDGTVVAPRTHNNRLDLWKTFLNRCRHWNYWPKKEKHPGETLERERVADKVPDIFTVDQGQALLQAVRKEEPALLNYLVTGCWLGPRPEEIKRIVPGMWDWERGYVNLDARVANKVMQQRFVPIPDNVRAILGGVIVDPRPRNALSRGRRGPKICGVMAPERLSRLARKKGIVEQWTPDIMRHSYISYRLAQGHGRGQVAEWAGNSEEEIRKVYRRPLRKEDGEAWFRIGLEAS